MLRATFGLLAASFLAFQPGLVPATAQDDPPEAESVRLASISPWTDATRPLRIALQVTNTGEADLVDANIRVGVYARVLSRSQLRSSLDVAPQTALLGTATVPVARLLPGRTAEVRFSRPMDQIANVVNRTGVYPITITLTHSEGEVILRSAMPYFASAPEEPLNVSWVLQISAPTMLTAGGYDPERIDAAGFATLTQQLNEIASRPGAVVTLAFNPSLLAALEDLADGYTVLGGSTLEASAPAARAAAGVLAGARAAARAAGELAAQPYAPVDPPTLAQRGTRGELIRQLTFGRSEVQAVLGRAPARGSLVPNEGSLDRAAADLLEGAGVDLTLLDPSAVEIPAEPFQPQLFGPSRPVALRTSGDMTGLITDAPLRGRLDGPERGVLLAQSLIAESASAWLELPLFAGDRLLTVSSRSLPSPPALAAALDGLSAAPWVRLVTMTQAAQDLDPQGPAVRFVRGPKEITENLTAARRARRSLTALHAITEELPEEMASLDRLILSAESHEWARAPGRGTALAAAVSGQVAQAFDRIRIARRDQVTLTSRTGEIPITIVNENSFPVRVRVRLSGAKVAFPEGDSRKRDVAAARPDTIDFSVEALATGSFNIDVIIETPDGAIVIARSTLLLRSTAVSAVTLALVGGSAVFLVIASIRRAVRQKRRAVGSEAGRSP